MKKIIGAINDANKKFNLIKDGDKIGVGVSGGKDSTILFIALKKFAQYMKKTKG
jgi:tRNA(Ile)-lysidine synthase TilS/MesJ